MKTRIWKIVLLLAVPLALLAFISERNSWRPKTIWVPNAKLVKVLFSPDGRYLVAQKDNGSVLLIDVQRREVLKKLCDSVGGRMFFAGAHLAMTPDEMLTGSRRTQIWSIPAGRRVADAPGNFLATGVLPDGETLWSCGYLPRDRQRRGALPNILAWNFKTRAAVRSIGVLPSATREGSVLPDGVTVLAWSNQIYQFGGGRENCFVSKPPVLRDLKDSRKKSALSGLYCLQDPVTCRQRSLMALHNSSAINIWNYQTGQRIRQITEPDLSDSVDPFYIGWRMPQQVAFSNAGDIVARAGAGYAHIKFWNIATGRLVRQIKVAGVNSIDFSPDDHTLATCGNDGTVKLWRIK